MLSISRRSCPPYVVYWRFCTIFALYFLAKINVSGPKKKTYCSSGRLLVVCSCSSVSVVSVRSRLSFFRGFKTIIYTSTYCCSVRKPTPNTKLLLLLFSIVAVTRDVSEKSDSEMTDYCIDMWKWKNSISRRAPLWHRTISSTVVSRSELSENQ